VIPTLAKKSGAAPAPINTSKDNLGVAASPGGSGANAISQELSSKQLVVERENFDTWGQNQQTP
jgi:hypothetical protein